MKALYLLALVALPVAAASPPATPPTVTERATELRSELLAGSGHVAAVRDFGKVLLVNTDTGTGVMRLGINDGVAVLGPDGTYLGPAARVLVPGEMINFHYFAAEGTRANDIELR